MPSASKSPFCLIGTTITVSHYFPTLIKVSTAHDRFLLPRPQFALIFTTHPCKLRRCIPSAMWSSRSSLCLAIVHLSLTPNHAAIHHPLRTATSALSSPLSRGNRVPIHLSLFSLLATISTSTFLPRCRGIVIFPLPPVRHRSEPLCWSPGRSRVRFRFESSLLCNSFCLPPFSSFLRHGSLSNSHLPQPLLHCRVQPTSPILCLLLSVSTHLYSMLEVRVRTPITIRRRSPLFSSHTSASASRVLHRHDPALSATGARPSPLLLSLFRYRDARCRRDTLVIVPVEKCH